jgi:pimeloyl-ACP methyl ester carboxylesterase
VGGAAGLGQVFSGVKSAALNLLNFTTYYQMKERAGLVGSSGVNAVMRQIRAKFPGLKVHLIGHSFGGRLVTAAADGPANQPPVKPNSMTLLQAAFSHNGFAEKFDQSHDGFFRKVVTDGKVSGPIVITYTKNDNAVGLMYPLASLIAGRTRVRWRRHDPYGGIGRNGAQKTPEAVNGILVGRQHVPVSDQQAVQPKLDT